MNRNATGAKLVKGNTCRNFICLTNRVRFTTGGPVSGDLADDLEYDREERDADEAERRFAEAAACLVKMPQGTGGTGSRQHGHVGAGNIVGASNDDGDGGGEPPPAKPTSKAVSP